LLWYFAENTITRKQHGLYFSSHSLRENATASDVNEWDHGCQFAVFTFAIAGNVKVSVNVCVLSYNVSLVVNRITVFWIVLIQSIHMHN